MFHPNEGPVRQYVDAVPWQRLRFLVDFWVDVWQVPEVFGGFFEEIYGIFAGLEKLMGIWWKMIGNV